MSFFLCSNQVVLVSGETGCGKTTQVYCSDLPFPSGVLEVALVLFFRTSTFSSLYFYEFSPESISLHVSLVC